jgi:ParB/RepB/Spo0J family partition protein
MEEGMKISIADIKTKQLFRSEYNNLDDLTQSIIEHGVIVPIKVKEISGGYELIYGHRRVEASKLAGLKEIEATIEGVDDMEALLQSVIENIQREDLSDIEEGEAFAAIKKQTGWTDEKIGKSLGKKETYIRERLQLVRDSGEILSEFRSRDRKTDEEGPIKVQDAAKKAVYIRKLEKSSPSLVKPVAEKVVKEGLTSRQTERLVSIVQDVDKSDGAKKAIQVLSKPYEEILPSMDVETRPSPVKKHEPTATEKMKSSFLQTEEFDAAMMDVKEISAFISFIKKNKDMNRKSAIGALREVKKFLEILIKQIDSVLGEI